MIEEGWEEINIPDGDGVKKDDDWLDSSKACKRDDPECEACQ